MEVFGQILGATMIIDLFAIMMYSVFSGSSEKAMDTLLFKVLSGVFVAGLLLLITSIIIMFFVNGINRLI